MTKSESNLHGIELGLFFWEFFLIGKMLEKLSSPHKGHNEVEFIGSLKGISQSNQERVIDMLQNHFLSFGMLNLILFDNIFLDDRFHCKELFCIFLFYKQHCSKGSFSQDDLGNEIIY